MPARPKKFAQYPDMANRAMARKLMTGRAIDVSGCERYGGAYILPSFIEGVDYCDRKTEEWIWSIGRRKSDGVILASKRDEFYQNDNFECLWLR
jgi:hypothetical protein